MDDLHLVGALGRIEVLQRNLEARFNTLGRREAPAGRRTLTGRAFGSLSSASSVESSIDVGMMGRSTSRPCARIESRNIASIAPWWRVTYRFCDQSCRNVVRWTLRLLCTNFIRITGSRRGDIRRAAGSLSVGVSVWFSGPKYTFGRTSIPPEGLGL